jgi:hypothetical protein
MATINLPSKYYTTSWSEKPIASTMQDEIIFVSDIGPSGNFFISNGTRWQPLGGSCLLGCSNTTILKTGYNGEEIATSVLIPGGLMSANGQLEIFHMTSHTSNANTKRLRIRHNDTLVSGTGASYYSASFTTTLTSQSYTYIRNDNSLTAQFGHSAGTTSGFGPSGIAGTSATLDTSLDTYVIMNVELNDTADAVSLEGFWITYLEG